MFRTTEIDKKIRQLIDKQKKEEFMLLANEKTRILEMVAAYKERRDLENQLKRAEQKAGEAEAKVIGWNQLFQGLHHFTKVFARYAKADETSKQVAELTEKMKSGKEEISALRQRQEVIHGKIERLKTYYKAQASISSAQAMAGLLERIGEFQTAQI
ncbi:hypothetical protein [Waddlia chondrophila]|uniref:Uncharacterized protein n=1 Tax=Waddlia chondrophila (strain ATCC VR-1470 / WSU 86-1044) TaxID=716544 RepID=D6YRS7_WADCW|nr:hypothetical protein [Waddlia chondrophila]ADI38772.1 hypothetical protein wcw_1422 [Waddlia chondrophila WSU 86-1044]